MFNLRVISSFGLDFKTETKKECELYVDVMPSKPKTCTRILWIIEPNEVSMFRSTVLRNYSMFDLILTWDNIILEECPNAKLFLYGTTWIKDFDLSVEKKYCITSLIGGKYEFIGHQLRQRIPDKLKSVESIPIHFFESSNNPSYMTNIHRVMTNNMWKNELFYSQFHIVIENVFEENWFTEKLIDCFQTKTIPIYMGCNNIGDFFDITGMFKVDSLDDMEKVCSGLTPKTYENMLKSVEKNYQESFKYTDFRDRLKIEINSFLEKI